MGANPDTKLQVNFSTPNRTLINVYAEDGPELAALLGDLSDVVTLLTETEALFGAVSAVQPISQGQVTAQAVQPVYGAPTPVGGGLPQPDTAEYCAHGQMTWKTGIAKASGNPYGLWECPTGQKPPAGCESRWPKRGR